jgi:transcriptional regulator GlxA family with amidase domain
MDAVVRGNKRHKEHHKMVENKGLLPDESGLEVKYEKLISVLRRIEDNEVDALEDLEKHCPSSVQKFIRLFATELGAKALAYLALEILMKGLK